jgi:hypothetical protein
MAEILPIGEIKSRCEAIGVSLKQLASSAGIDPATAYSAARGDSDMLSRNLAALTRALIARETKVREHLDMLPAPQTERGAA